MDEQPTPTPEEALTAARSRRQNSEAQCRNVEGRWRLVHALSQRMRDIREDNHFSEKWAELLRGSP